MNLLPVLALVYPAIMIHAGIGDLRTMRIPNRLVLALLAGYLVLVPVVGFSLSDVLSAVVSATIVFALGFLAFSWRWMGGGDVKLLTVAALWLGAENVAPFIFYTSIFGAVLTIIILFFRSVRLPVAWRGQDWILQLHQNDGGVPYGVAIAAAGMLVYLRTPWVVAQF